WHWMPILPREVMRLHEPDVLLGFGPGGTSAVVGTGQLARHAPVWEKLKLVAVPNGEVLATLPENSESLGHSVDAGIWVFRQGDSCFEFDAVDRKIARLKISGAGSLRSRGITSDGRFFVFEPEPYGRRATVWDLVHDRQQGLIQHEAWADGCDADGRPVILAWGQPRNRLIALDPESLKERASMIVPDAADGSSIVIGLPPPTPRFAAGALVTQYRDLKVYEHASGRLRFSIPHYCRSEPSPDGRTLFVAYREQSESFFE